MRAALLRLMVCQAYATTPLSHSSQHPWNRTLQWKSQIPFQKPNGWKHWSASKCPGNRTASLEDLERPRLGSHAHLSRLAAAVARNALAHSTLTLLMGMTAWHEEAWQSLLDGHAQVKMKGSSRPGTSPRQGEREEHNRCQQRQVAYSRLEDCSRAVPLSPSRPRKPQTGWLLLRRGPGPLRSHGDPLEAVGRATLQEAWAMEALETGPKWRGWHLRAGVKEVGGRLKLMTPEECLPGLRWTYQHCLRRWRS